MALDGKAEASQFCFDKLMVNYTIYGTINFCNNFPQGTAHFCRQSFLCLKYYHVQEAASYYKSMPRNSF